MILDVIDNTNITYFFKNLKYMKAQKIIKIIIQIITVIYVMFVTKEKSIKIPLYMKLITIIINIIGLIIEINSIKLKNKDNDQGLKIKKRKRYCENEVNFRKQKSSCYNYRY